MHEHTVRYADGNLKHILKKEELPFQYESNGIEIYFTDIRDPIPRQREIFHFHKPETLEDLSKQNSTLRKTSSIFTASSNRWIKTLPDRSNNKS